MDSEEEINQLREKIQNTHIFSHGIDISVTVSGGVASYPEDGQTQEEIIGKADKVLYSECKNKGKNRVCAYNSRIENFYPKGDVQSF